MTCKDCLYFPRCVVLGVELDIKHNKEADKNCRHFKNKSDYEEVKHGEWIWTETGDKDYEQYWICSVCGEKDYIKSKYCPECGADMSAK